MDRDMVINRLIEDDIDYIVYPHDFLRYVLYHGFKGYAKMTNEELEFEFNSRDFPD